MNHAAKELLDRIKQLKKNMSQKDISDILEMNPSVFSNLYRKVLPAMVDNDGPDPFYGVNNVSKSIAKKFVYFLARLDGVLENNEKPSILTEFIESLKLNLYDNSKILDRYNLAGVYAYCYKAISSKKVIINPFLIIKAEIGYEVFYGTKSNKYKYKGLIYPTGSHSITLWLVDSFEYPQETKNIVLSVPFADNYSSIKGVFSTLGTGREIACGKCLLIKLEDVIEKEAYWNEAFESYAVFKRDIPPSISSYFDLHSTLVHEGDEDFPKIGTTLNYKKSLN